MQRELSQFPHAREMSASQIRRSLYLSRRDVRARVEPDGSSSWVYSAAVRKLIFGRELTEAFKIQSGVKIAVKSQDPLLKASPTCITYSNRGQERIQASQSFHLLTDDGAGSVRRVRLENRGEVAVRTRILTLHDPTSLNYRRDRDPPGEIGVNAFNRQDQVVMDDVGDSTGVRVLSFSPRPSMIYMTRDKNRAAELLALGELPESSLGMSGCVIVITQHDIDLPPGSSIDVQIVSVYNVASLESALSAASHGAKASENLIEPRGVSLSSSNASINFAFEWAKAALFSIEGEPDLLDRLCSGVALSLVRPDYFERFEESFMSAIRKDGTVGRHEEAPGFEKSEVPAPLETSVHLISACAFLNARPLDKKAIRKWYPRIKRAGEGLSKLAASGLIPSSTQSPDGWRRRLGAGFPTGVSSEVNITAIRALRDASTTASFAGKGNDSAKFRELGERLLSGLNEKLRDPESGALALNLDCRGVLHKEMTIDQAVGLSFYSPDKNLASSVVHRLLEKDFETGYGPRTVPSSNNLYYSPSYAEGQLGGYWTRAAISHAMLAYSTGYPSIGSLLLEKVARLVHLDSERMGGIPGEFPYCLDPERKQILSHGSDPVAAGRFIEALIFGELGLDIGSRGASFSVPDASQMKWLLVRDLEIGKKGSLFVGRTTGRTFVVTTFEKAMIDDRPGDAKSQSATVTTTTCLSECARVSATGLEAAVFWDADSMFLCVGNPAAVPSSSRLSVPVRSAGFSSSLFAEVEELKEQTGLWEKRERLKLTNALEMKVDLKPNSWKVLKISPFRQ